MKRPMAIVLTMAVFAALFGCAVEPVEASVEPSEVPSVEPSVEVSVAPSIEPSPSGNPAPDDKPMSYEEYFSEIRALEYTDRYAVDYDKTPFEVVVGEWDFVMYKRTLVERESGKSYGDWWDTYILLDEDGRFDKLIYYLPGDGIYIKDAESDTRVFEQRGERRIVVSFSDDVLMFWDHGIDGECRLYRLYVPTGTVDLLFSLPEEAHHYPLELIEDFETFIACDRPLLEEEEMISNCEYRIATTCPAYFERMAKERGIATEELYRELASVDGYSFMFAIIYNSLLDEWWGNDMALEQYGIPPEKRMNADGDARGMC